MQKFALPNAPSMQDIRLRPEEFQAAVLNWFDNNGRKNLPWQIEPTPYRVWVSEIMLQQTQVATVIPYFLRFTGRFPDVATLAAAALEEALSYWAGLGYYARARHLHRAARMMMTHHGGDLPTSLETLCELPGIGRSTAGAILSLGLGIPAPILDGNVKRVLSRHTGISGWPGEPRIARELWAISERYTPRERVGAYNQAMMDLGATVCTRTRPRCTICPLHRDCEARRHDLTASIPGARPARAVPVKRCFMLALRNSDGAFLLRRRPPTGIWGGLLSLPEFDSEAELRQWCSQWHLDIPELEYLPERRHTFTHFHLDYRPVVATARVNNRVSEPSAGAWYPLVAGLALPAPVRRLLEELSAREQICPHR